MVGDVDKMDCDNLSGSCRTADTGCPLIIANVNRGRDHCWQDVHSCPVLGGDRRRGEGLLLLGHPA